MRLEESPGSSWNRVIHPTGGARCAPPTPLRASPSARGGESRRSPPSLPHTHLLAHPAALTPALRRLVPRTTASQQRARDHDAPKNANLPGLHVTVPALFKWSFTASTPRDGRRRVSTVRHPLGCANPVMCAKSLMSLLVLTG